MVQETTLVQRRYERISMPQGMYVAWYGGDEQEVSRVRTMGMGGLFITTHNPPPLGAKLILVFEIPGGSVQADAVVRSVVSDTGMGVEFTRLALSDRILLERLLKRLLR
jgi:PilZ domain-containing protein